MNPQDSPLDRLIDHQAGPLVAAGVVVALLAIAFEMREMNAAPVPCDNQAAQLTTALDRPEPPQTDPDRSEPPAIQWMTAAEAAADPKPDWWHVTAPDVRTCPACLIAERHFEDPLIRGLATHFNVIRCHRVAGETPRYPQDIFTSADRLRYRRNEGCPKNVFEYRDQIRNALNHVDPQDLGP